MKIVNLTQHTSSADQMAAGVVDLPEADRANVSALLTFDDLPGDDEVAHRAAAIAAVVAHSCDCAMIGGAPYLMAPLIVALRAVGVEPVFAFSRRESTEIVQPDGSARKTAVFRHAGWVRA